MGGAQSTATRKITIPNEDNLVKVSDSVAERLKKCQEPEKPELKKEACDPDDFQTKVSSNQVSSIPGKSLSCFTHFSDRIVPILFCIFFRLQEIRPPLIYMVLH